MPLYQPGFLNLGIKAAATWHGSFAAMDFRYTFFFILDGKNFLLRNALNSLKDS